MTTIDFRETLYPELDDPEFRRGFIEAFFEQDGIVGIHYALQCIAEADRYAKTGTLPAEKPRATRRVVRRGKAKSSPNDADLLRRKLRAHGLDFALTLSK